MTDLPDTLPGHWTTAEGAVKAREYATMTRAQLSMGDKPDLGLANAIYLIDRNSLELIHFQTAAKERIRWLSVQLALREAELARAEKVRDGLNAQLTEQFTLTTKLAADLDALQRQPIRIGVNLEGGVIQSVYSDRDLPNVRVLVIDYDTEGADEGELVEVRQTDGPDAAWAEALVSVHKPEVVSNNDWVNDFRDPETGETANIWGETTTQDIDLDPLMAAMNDGIMAEASLEQLACAFRNDRAEAEGWIIGSSDTYGYEIQADPESDRFVRAGCAYDDEAVEHVRRLAPSSLYHRLALAIHEKQAAERKAAAEAAGYGIFRITTDGDTGAYGFQRPGSLEGGGPFWTEEAAWAAAYRDLGENGDD